MSNRIDAEARFQELNAVPMDDVGHVLVVGLQGAISALLDVADAIREQTTAFQDDGIRALTERNA